MNKNKKWIIAGACFIFFIVLVSYFQLASTPKSTDQAEVIEEAGDFDYQIPPIQANELTDVLADKGPKMNINDIQILTSIKQEESWLVLVQFKIEEGWLPLHALVEVKKESNNYRKKLLTVAAGDFTGNGHWYDVKYNVGFGSGKKYVERVFVQTDQKDYESYLHNGYYIYRSDEKPEKVTFYSTHDKVMRTMETFNFDPAYPLVADREDEYALFVVDKNAIEWSNKLKEQGISEINAIQMTTSLENANREFEFLDLEKSPAFVVFNHKGMIFKTYNEEDLITFLWTLGMGSDRNISDDTWDLSPTFEYPIENDAGEETSYTIVGNKNTFGFTGPIPVTKQVNRYFWFYFGDENIFGKDVQLKAIKKGENELIDVYSGVFSKNVSIGDKSVNMLSNMAFSSTGTWKILVFIDDAFYESVVIQVE